MKTTSTHHTPNNEASTTYDTLAPEKTVPFGLTAAVTGVLVSLWFAWVLNNATALFDLSRVQLVLVFVVPIVLLFAVFIFSVIICLVPGILPTRITKSVDSRELTNLSFKIGLHTLLAMFVVSYSMDFIIPTPYESGVSITYSTAATMGLVVGLALWGAAILVVYGFLSLGDHLYS